MVLYQCLSIIEYYVILILYYRCLQIWGKRDAPTHTTQVLLFPVFMVLNSAKSKRLMTYLTQNDMKVIIEMLDMRHHNDESPGTRGSKIYGTFGEKQ